MIADLFILSGFFSFGILVLFAARSLFHEDVTFSIALVGIFMTYLGGVTIVFSIFAVCRLAVTAGALPS